MCPVGGIEVKPDNQRLLSSQEWLGGIMIHNEFAAAPSRRPMRSRLRYGKRHLEVEVRLDLFQLAFTDFSSAAEAFAASLSDEVHRNFAFRYLKYLQDTAQGRTLVQLNRFGVGPAYRLIRAELDRLFDLSFLSTDRKIAA
jgi:hypothetical protein